MNALSKQEIENKLKELNNWYLDKDAIRKDWLFSDFVQAMDFINTVADLAEKQNHHPEILNVYNKVSLRFNSHDVGGITTRDFRIAAAIDQSEK